MKRLIIISLILLLTTTVYALWPYQQKPVLGRQVDWSDPLSEGLIGCWVMNEGTGTSISDLSGNKNTGTFNAGAAAPVWVAGNIEFDGGDDTIQIQDGGARLVNFWDNGGTVVMSLNVQSDGGNNEGRIIQRDNRWDIIADNEAGGATKVFFDHGWSGVNIAYRSDNTVVSLLVDTSIAVIYNSSAVGNIPILYIDGNVVAFSQVTGPPTGIRLVDSGNLMELGNTLGIRGFDGTFRYCYIYDRILSASEILQLHINPFIFMQGDLPVSMMFDYSAEGQVIFIQMGCLPIILLVGCLLWRNRERKAA